MTGALASLAPPRAKTQRALAYLRVSTISGQRNSKSLDGQLLEVRAYCKAKGYTLRGALKQDKKGKWVGTGDVYVDVISGARTDREGYYELLQRIERQDAAVIVAWEVPRFGRNSLDTAWLVAKAKEYELRLETSTWGRDFLADPEGELLFDVLAAVAKYERNSSLRRMQRGKRTGHERGHFVAGGLLFGYKPEGPRGAKVLLPHPVQAPVVRAVFERYAAGASLNELAQWLQLHPDVGAMRTWRATAVGRILANPTYVGQLTLKGSVVKGQHEALVAQDLYDAVQARRAQERARHPGRRPKRGERPARQDDAGDGQG